MKKLLVSSSINLHDWPMSDVSEYIRRGLLYHKESGFDAADFTMKLVPHMGDNWQSYIEQALEDSRQIGIPFALCHLPYSTRICKHPEEVGPFNTLVHRAIDAAAMLGVDYAVIHPNSTTVPLTEFDSEKAYDSVMYHLAPFAEHSARVGLSMVVENMCLYNRTIPSHRYCADPEELCRIADALGVGICWDTGHGNMRGLVQSKALAYIGKRLKMLHINDNLATGDNHLPPFMGSIDWKDVMEGLAAVGFEGYFNFEISTGNQPAQTRVAFGKYLKSVADTLLDMI